VGPKVVLDTNVLVSALGWKGSPYQVFRRCIDGQCQIFISPALIRETARVLTYPKLGVNDAQRDEFLTLLAETATIVEPDITLDLVSADPSDNRILECALAADCRYIITGDKHLLELNTFRDIQIVTPDVFLASDPGPARPDNPVDPG
jgi:putative PIN family toxin of toxin-antitoxin system